MLTNLYRIRLFFYHPNISENFSYLQEEGLPSDKKQINSKRITVPLYRTRKFSTLQESQILLQKCGYTGVFAEPQRSGSLRNYLSSTRPSRAEETTENEHDRAPQKNLESAGAPRTPDNHPQLNSAAPGQKRSISELAIAYSVQLLRLPPVPVAAVVIPRTSRTWCTRPYRRPWGLKGRHHRSFVPSPEPFRGTRTRDARRANARRSNPAVPAVWGSFTCEAMCTHRSCHDSVHAAMCPTEAL